MRRSGIFISAVCAFAAGAFLASREGEAPSVNPREIPGERASNADGQDRAIAGTPGVRVESYVRLLSAMQSGQSLKQRHDLSEAIRDVETGEFGELIARAGKLPSRESGPLVSALLESWLQRDAGQATAWVKAHPGSNFREAWLAWGRLAPESAILEVHRNPGSVHAQGMLQAAVAALAGPQPGAQAARLAALPANSARDQVLEKALDAWSVGEPSAAYAFTKSLPPGPMKAHAERFALETWLDRDSEAALRAVMAILPELRDSQGAVELVAVTAGKLAGDDPNRALEWLRQLPESMRGTAAFLAVAKAWAGEDPIAALDWCVANGVDIAHASKDHSTRSKLVFEPQIKTGAFTNPNSYFSGATEQHAIVGSVLEEAMEEDDSGTLDWIRSLPDPSTRARLLERALTVDSPLTELPLAEDRTKTIAELLPAIPADARDQVAYEMAKNFDSFETARAWADQLSDPISRAAVIEAAVEDHGDEWDDDVEGMLNQFPKGYQRDAALRGLAGCQPSDEGVETAMRIQNPKTRHLVLDLIVSEWLDSDPDEAQAWLINQSPNLPREWLAEWKR
jgi:hypothetical protein